MMWWWLFEDAFFRAFCAVDDQDSRLFSTIGAEREGAWLRVQSEGSFYGCIWMSMSGRGMEKGKSGVLLGSGFGPVKWRKLLLSSTQFFVAFALSVVAGIASVSMRKLMSLL